MNVKTVMLQTKATTAATGLVNRLKQVDAFLIPGIAVSYLATVRHLAKNLVFQRRCAEANVEYLIHRYLSGSGVSELCYRDTIDNQKISYIANATVYDLCRDRGPAPKLIVGYSMGLYAALYAGGYYAYETGLEIVEGAYRLVASYCQGRQYTMGIVLGFTRDEVERLLVSPWQDQIRIAMHNGRHNFVLAGERNALERCLETAQREGAIGVRRILTEHPYHTEFLNGMADEFARFLLTFDYRRPQIPVISLVDGRAVEAGATVEAIVSAMTHPLYLDRAIERIHKLNGVETCYDVGPEKSMQKLVRYIDRSLRVQPVQKVLFS